MNNQVKNYFVRQKYKTLYEQYLRTVPYQPNKLDNFLNVLLEAQHGVTLKVSDDDLNFVHALRALSHEQTKGEHVPTTQNAIVARYLLTHELPLHNFEAEWDDHTQTMEILDTYKRPEGGSKTVPFAKVNDNMRDQYKRLNNIKANLEKGEESDRKVANWWMEAHKNAVFFKDKTEKNKDANPSPILKILRKGSDSVDFSFKTGRRYVTWTDVRNVPVDMEKFRKQLLDQGFDFEKHPGLMLRQTRQTWDNLMDTEEKDDDKDQYDRKTQLKMPRLKKDNFKPGHNIAWDKVDKEIFTKYENEKDFRKQIEEKIVQSTAKNTGAKIFVNWDDDAAVGDDSKYNINIIRDKAKVEGLDDNMVRDIMSSARIYLFNNSGHGDLSDPKFLGSTIATGVMNTIRKIKLDKNRKAQDIGGGAEPGGKGDGGRAGGRMQIAATGGGGGGSGGAGTDVSLSQGAGAAKVGRVQGFQSQDYRQDGGGFTPDDLIQHIKSDPSSMVSDPEVQEYILKYADHPVIGNFANHIINNNLLLPGVDKSNDDEDGTAKYAPSPRRVPAHQESVLPFSFKDYVAKKDKINEMGIVWGNDKNSVNKIKPGQTLKGGIQVQGAPWSVINTK